MSAGTYESTWDRIAQTGDWWTDPWWENTVVHLDCSKDVLRAATKRLRPYFDAEWAKELARNPRHNLIFPTLCIEKSTMAAGFIVGLGELVRVLEASEGFRRKIAELKGEKSESTFFELELAHTFAISGYEVRFPREGGSKSPDIVASLGSQHIAIECKRLQSEVWENWEDVLTSRVIQSTPMMKGDRQVSVQVALNPRLTEVRVEKDGDGSLNSAFLEAIVQAINAEIARLLSEQDPPISYRFGELASIDIFWRDEGKFGSVSGMERASPSMFRRVFSNGVLRATEQLPLGMPGVIAIYSKVAPNPHFFRLFFDAACQAQADRFGHVTAVLVCSHQTIFAHTAPLIYENRFTRYAEDAKRVNDLLKSDFKAITG